MLTYEHPVRVRYVETDGMRVAHHSNYAVWFEEARVALLDDMGCPYRELEERDLLIPVLECSATFRKPAHFDDLLTIVLRMEQKPGVRWRFDYEVKRDAETLATGYTKHAFMSRALQPIRPPKDVLERFAKYF